MEIKIEGNPGTGNSFSEVNIQHVENYNPAATSVTNNYYGDHREPASRQPKSGEGTGTASDTIDTAPIRTEILNYVSCIRPYLSDSWKSRYMQVWNDILDLDIVAQTVYNPGKQQGTNFNRNLVANIIYFLDQQGAYSSKYSATTMAVALEGDKDHPVRAALGSLPPADITSRLNRMFE